MKKSLFISLLLMVSVSCFCQTGNLWKGYFSYNEVVDLAQSTTKCISASENALFSKDIQSGEIKTTNTVDGLPSEKISAVYHSNAFNKTLVGYETGLMVVINDADGSILKVVDILNKQIAPNIKKVNHFMEHEGTLYIACDFGIVQYNLTTLEFGDTYFIGTGVAEIIVNQTAILNGYMYAATTTEGLKRAALSNPNLIDATQWEQTATGNFLAAETFGTSLVVGLSTGELRRSTNGNSFTPVGSSLSPAMTDVRATTDYLVVTTPTRVFLYNENFGVDQQIIAAQLSGISPVFTCATVVGNNVFVGTKEQGLLSFALNNTTTFEQISPDGPQRNNAFSVTLTPSGKIWTVFGEYNQYYSPKLREYGVSKYNGESGWLNIPYSEVDGAHDLVRVTVNPNNEDEVYISSHHDGLLKFENDVLTQHYTYTNSGLESLVLSGNPSYKSVRIEQSAFDKQGNLWMSNGLIKNAIKELKANGEWASVSVEGIVDDLGTTRLGRMVIDKNDTKWYCSLEDGLMGYNQNRATPFRQIDEGADGGNLPATSVQAIAIDNRNQLWIGTRKGLRILSSVDRFMEPEDTQLNTYAIIIDENGLAQELMYEQFITDIVVDGANNKWISTATAGVFLVSSDGQQTLHHFTSSNSPLPNNNVNDMAINSATGEVFFATVSGLVSYKGTAIEASGDLTQVKVFPNPVRPGYAGTVKIAGLTDKADVKITDIEGNLVYEIVSDGGTIEWDTTAFGKYRVASGVYMVFIATAEGTETKVKKLMIVR